MRGSLQAGRSPWDGSETPAITALLVAPHTVQAAKRRPGGHAPARAVGTFRIRPVATIILIVFVSMASQQLWFTALILGHKDCRNPRIVNVLNVTATSRTSM